MHTRMETRTERATDAMTGFIKAYAFLISHGANQPHFLGVRRDPVGDPRYWDFRVVGLGQVTVVTTHADVYLQ